MDHCRDYSCEPGGVLNESSLISIVRGHVHLFSYSDEDSDSVSLTPKSLVGPTNPLTTQGPRSQGRP